MCQQQLVVAARKISIVSMKKATKTSQDRWAVKVRTMYKVINTWLGGCILYYVGAENKFLESEITFSLKAMLSFFLCLGKSEFDFTILFCFWTIFSVSHCFDLLRLSSS